MKKVSGPTLFFSQFGGEQPIPPEFIAAMNRKEEITAVPNDVGPEALGDEIVESKVETNRTNERVKHTIKKDPGSITLRDVRTDQSGLPVQVTRVLFQTGSMATLPPSATTRVAIQDLGNGWSIQESSVMGFYDDDGNFIPSIFLGPRYENRIPDTVPAEFAVAVPVLTSEVNEVGQVSTNPILLTGDLDRWEQQVDQYLKRVHVESRATIAVPITLISKDTNAQKQVVTITKIYKNQGSDALPTATTEVAVQNLGDGRVIETTRSVTTFFIGPRYENRRSDGVPPEFSIAVPVLTIENTQAGQASTNPVLVTGDLSHWEEQVDTFLKRVHVESRSSVAVPITLVGKDTNAQKQVVTITKTYRDRGVAAALPSATQEVAVQSLGDGPIGNPDNGRVIETVRSVSNVFAAQSYETSIEDFIPQEFKALLKNTRISVDAAGQAVLIPLASGEFSHKETNLDSFTKRTETLTRDTTTSPSLEDHEFGGVQAGGSLFSGDVTKLKTYTVGAQQSIEQSFLKFASVVQNLGNGSSVRETQSLTAYPIYTDYVNEDRSTVLTRTKQIVATGTALPASGLVSQQVIDSQRTLRITETLVADIASTYQLYRGMIDVQLPAELQSLIVMYTAQGGDGAYSETGTYGLAGKGSSGIALRGSAKASSAVIPDVVPGIKQPWTDSVPCIHYVFPVGRLQGNVTGGTQISLWTVLFGPSGSILQGQSLSPWPQFAPREVNLSLSGSRVSFDIEVNVHANDVLTTDYNGVVKLSGSSRSQGVGVSADVEITQKTVRIPPTIHPAITIAVPLLKQTNTAVGTISSGVNTSTLTATSIATGTVNDKGDTGTANVIIPATPGRTTIPITGWYLYKFFVEYYKNDIIFLHYVIVDFTNVL